MIGIRRLSQVTNVYLYQARAKRIIPYMIEVGELDTKTAYLKVQFENCPVAESLGVLGHKWSLLILRNIELFGKHRFNEMLKVTPGLTRRVLSMRLKELKRDGFIEISLRSRSYTLWNLTQKGRDVLPILLALVQFGSKWYADRVFSDHVPRTLNQVFNETYIRRIMRYSSTDQTLSTVSHART